MDCSYSCCALDENSSDDGVVYDWLLFKRWSRWLGRYVSYGGIRSYILLGFSRTLTPKVGLFSSKELGGENLKEIPSKWISHPGKAESSLAWTATPLAAPRTTTSQPALRAYPAISVLGWPHGFYESFFYEVPASSFGLSLRNSSSIQLRLSRQKVITRCDIDYGI